jgi:hypothetical protein
MRLPAGALRAKGFDDVRVEANSRRAGGPTWSAFRAWQNPHPIKNPNNLFLEITSCVIVTESRCEPARPMLRKIRDDPQNRIFQIFSLATR